MKYKTHIYALLNYCAKGNTASETVEDYILISHQLLLSETC